MKKEKKLLSYNLGWFFFLGFTNIKLRDDDDSDIITNLKWYFVKKIKEVKST